jgi:hypothetical protein
LPEFFSIFLSIIITGEEAIDEGEAKGQNLPAGLATRRGTASTYG